RQRIDPSLVTQGLAIDPGQVRGVSKVERIDGIPRSALNQGREIRPVIAPQLESIGELDAGARPPRTNELVEAHVLEDVPQAPVRASVDQDVGLHALPVCSLPPRRTAWPPSPSISMAPVELTWTFFFATTFRSLSMSILPTSCTRPDED